MPLTSLIHERPRTRAPPRRTTTVPARVSTLRLVRPLSWLLTASLLFAAASIAYAPGGTPVTAARAIAQNTIALTLTPMIYVVRRGPALAPLAQYALAAAATSAVLLASLSLIQHASRRSNEAGAHNHARRRFLTRAVSVGAALGTTAVTAKAAAIDPLSLRTAARTIPIRNLPRELGALRIAHLTDLHVGARVPAELLERAVRRAVELRPDLIVLTGDIVHGHPAQIPYARRLLAPLVTPGASRYGAVAVMGNHDHYAGAALVRHALESIGIRTIDNDRLFLTTRGLSATAADAPALCIAGLGDLWMDRTNPTAAFRDVPESAPRLLITHQPDTAELESLTRHGAPRIDLMLCGHTHGGQVRLPFLGTPFIPSRHGAKYAGGLVQGPAFPVLVSRGVGMSLLPLRFNVPPEVGAVTLVRV